MIPAQFPEQNEVFQPGEKYLDIPAYKDGTEIVTKYQLSKEDLDMINQTGFIWLRVSGKTYPTMRITAYSPFRVPRAIEVNTHISERVFLYMFEDEELVFVKIDPEQHSFKVNPPMPGNGITSGLDWWALSFRTGKGGRFFAYYEFKEEVEVIGMAGDHPEYQHIYDQYDIDPVHTLILNRVEKTKFE